MDQEGEEMSGLNHRYQKYLDKFFKESSKRTRIVVSLSVIALLLFLSAAALLPFKDKIFDYLYPKPKSQATETYPPRGIEGDLWADIEIGERDFSEVNPKEIVPFRVFNPNGVTVDRSVSPGRAYVWDSSNSRILGFDLAKCYGKDGEPCSADVVIGQPSGYDYGACNGDSGFQNYPQRAKATEKTLCGVWEGNFTVLEEKSLSGMYAASNGDLYVPDTRNNRILKYVSPFTTNTVADEVWGQDNFSGNECNKTGSYLPVNYPAPTKSSLCYISNRGAGLGVTLDVAGNLWVADGGNNRVLRFPVDSAGKISKTADIVIGQPDFTSFNAGRASDKTRFSSPSSVRFDNQGRLYVADSYFDGNNLPETMNRVSVFTPPFTANTVIAANSGTIFGKGFPDDPAYPSYSKNFSTPASIEIDPTGKGVVVLDSERRVSLWDFDGNFKTRFYLPSRSGGSIGIDPQGKILLSQDQSGQDIFRFSPQSNENYILDKKFFNPFPATATPVASGTPTGTPTLLPNPLFGKAAEFNGQTAIKIVSATNLPNLNSDFTIEMWIKPNKFTNTSYPEFSSVIGKITGNDFSTYEYILGFSNLGTGGMEPFAEIMNGGGVFGSTSLKTDGSTWYHLAMVRKNSNLRLFVNGKYNGDSRLEFSILNSLATLVIGAFSEKDGVLDYPFLGDLDELRISNSARYDADFTPSSSPFAPDANTLALWHFDGNTNDSAQNRTSQVIGNIQYVDNTIPVITPIPTSAPTPTPLPLFSYNLVSDKRLDNSAWVGMTVVGDQLVVAPGSRMLFWNGLNSLTNGKPADGYIGTGKINDFPDPGFGQMKIDADNRVWVLRGPKVEIYQAPLTIGAQPIKTLSQVGILGSTQKINLFPLGLVPTSHGEYLWVSEYPKHRVFRIRGPLTDNPVIDVVLGQNSFNPTDVSFNPNDPAAVNGYKCNRGEVLSPNNSPGRPASADAALNMLCFPGALSIDKRGNLFVSDHAIESAGNWRLLMFSTATFPASPSAVVFSPPATKEFPRRMSTPGIRSDGGHMTFEPAFDSQNHMVVGYNPYSVPGYGAGRIVHYYLNPTQVNPNNPRDSNYAKPDGYLNDVYGWAISSVFDANDNLYVFDANRSKVLIYKKPFIFTNLSANLPLEGPATFNFTYPAGSGPFKINVSTIADMSRDVYNNFASGGTSPITLDSPATVWNKYTCGRTVYWQITDATGTVKSPIQSTTISSNSPCPYVFATSTTYNGNLGGLAGADAKCQERATAVNLPGTYKAWLSDSTGSPSTRFNKSTAPYVLTDGTVIANNWDNLIAVDSSHYLKAAIRMTESKYTLYGPQTVDTAWSNSYANGTPLVTQRNCNNWTEGANGALYGDLGYIYSNGYSWSQGSAYAPCNISFRLYCFRQDIPAPSPTSTPSLTPTPTPMAISLTSGLIGLWRLDDNSGTTASDGSNGNHPVTLSGSASWTAGKLNSAVSLNGTTSYLDPISINGFGTLVGNSSYTVSLWTKTNIASTRQVILGDWDVNGASQSVALEFGGYNMPADHITTLWTSDTGTRRYLDSGVVYSPNTWYHIVVSEDGTTGARNFYINGALKNTDTVGKLGNGSKLTLGRAGAYNGFYLNGVIDDLRIYNRVLSAQEIQNLYNLTPASSGY